MNDELAQRLAALTSRFYDQIAPSFSATRQRPWQGWERLWDEVAPLVRPFDSERPLRVLDVGCGNLRFERLLEAKAPGAWEAWCVDGCPALMEEGVACLAEAMGTPLLAGAKAPKTLGGDGGRATGGKDDGQGAIGEGSGQTTLERDGSPATPGKRPAASALWAGGSLPVALRELDVIEALLDGAPAGSLARAFGAPAADLAVAFGFLHHVPGAEARARLLQALVQAVRPGGLIAVSLWQFADDERLHAKAEEATARGSAQMGLPSLPAGDYLLGWQDDPSIFRYCHSFDEAEVDALAAAAAAAGTPDAAAAAAPSTTSTTGAAAAAPRVVDDAGPHPAPPAAREVARFSADGKPGNLNRYLVLRRNG